MTGIDLRSILRSILRNILRSILRGVSRGRLTIYSFYSFTESLDRFLR